MNGFRSNRKPTERELAALADGSLSGARRARVERAVASSSELQADIAAQRSALHAIAQASEEHAPSSLRARLELARDPRRRPVARRGVWGTATAAVGAMAAAAVILLAGGPASAPTVASAATLAVRAPVMPAGAGHAGKLAWPFANGLSFPDWTQRFGFTAFGSRSDGISGHTATTVFYARGQNEIAYTIVSGRPLSIGTRSHESAWDGAQLWSFQERGRAVVTWLRSGHTCVLSGSPSQLGQLLRLAATETYGA